MRGIVYSWTFAVVAVGAALQFVAAVGTFAADKGPTCRFGLVYGFSRF